MYDELKELVLAIKSDMNNNIGSMEISRMKWDINFLQIIRKITIEQKDELLAILEPPIVEVVEAEIIG